MLDEASRDVLLYRLQGKEGPTQVWAKGALTETFGKHKRTDSLKVAANYAREWRKMRKSRAAARIIAGVEGDTRTRIVAGPIEAPRKAGPPPGEEKIDWSDVKGHVGLNPRRRNAKAAQRGNPRQISAAAARALAEFRPFKKGNTEVRLPHTAGDPSVLYLHGNAIAEIILGRGLFISDAGYPTPTTKERLNALPGVQVHTSRGQLYLNGKKWSGDWVRVDPEGNVYELGTNPRRRKNTAIKVGDRIRFPRGEEGEVTEMRDGWGYVSGDIQGWFPVSSLSAMRLSNPRSRPQSMQVRGRSTAGHAAMVEQNPRKRRAPVGISEEEARLQLREILRGRRERRPEESMSAAAMKLSHKESLSLGESWATLKSEVGIPHEFNPGGKRDRPRYGPSPSVHREVSFRDFKPLAPSKRTKALQTELERRRPHAGVGTWAWEAKRAGYMAYEKDGSRAKPKRYRGELADWKDGVKSARYTEYAFRYPSERDLERKATKEREEREKYRLRSRLEQLERGPWRERGGYQSFSKKRK